MIFALFKGQGLNVGHLVRIEWREGHQQDGSSGCTVATNQSRGTLTTLSQDCHCSMAIFAITRDVPSVVRLRIAN